ncbi:hypothetical protein MTO96_023742 [Rhipicephalus appendiculatus]
MHDCTSAGPDEHSNFPVPTEERRSDVSYKKVGLFNVQGLLLQQNEFDRDKIRKYIIWSLLHPGSPLPDFHTLLTKEFPCIEVVDADTVCVKEGAPRLVKAPPCRTPSVPPVPKPGTATKGTFADFFECFTRGEVAFGDYFDHVLSWYARKDDPRVLLLCYETMRKDPLGSVKLIADFLDIRTDQDLITQVARDTGLEETVAGRTDLEEEVLKGRVGCYREYFSKQQHRVLADMTKEKLAGTELLGVWADFVY